MTHSNLTRWIEDAEARKFYETAMAEQHVGTVENHYLRLGETVARIPSWFHHRVTCESLMAMGCHAVAYARHPLTRNNH